MWRFLLKLFIIAAVLHIHFDGYLPGRNLAEHRDPPPAGVERGGGYADDFSEAAALLKGAVEDTAWLFSTSPAELRQALSKYFTGPLLEQLVENTGDFKQKATDWPYQTVLEEYAVDLNGNQARAVALIREYDPIAKESQFTQLHFQLVRTKQGWRINALSGN